MSCFKGEYRCVYFFFVMCSLNSLVIWALSTRQPLAGILSHSEWIADNNQMALKAGFPTFFDARVFKCSLDFVFFFFKRRHKLASYAQKAILVSLHLFIFSTCLWYYTLVLTCESAQASQKQLFNVYDMMLSEALRVLKLKFLNQDVKQKLQLWKMWKLFSWWDEL